MEKLDKLRQEIYDSGIKVVNFNTKEITGLAVEYNKQQKIVINKAKIKNKTHERTILAHEFYHFKTGTLYRLTDSSIVQDKKEYKCNKYMIQKLVPIDEFKELLSKNYQRYELAFFFDVEESVIELAFEIYKKMNLL